MKYLKSFNEDLSDSKFEIISANNYLEIERNSKFVNFNSDEVSKIREISSIIENSDTDISDFYSSHRVGFNDPSNYYIKIKYNTGYLIFGILKLDDEWYILTEYINGGKTTSRTGNFVSNIEQIKCDQFDGLLECLRERVNKIVSKNQ